MVFEYNTEVINTIDFEQCQHEQCPELHIEYLKMTSPVPLANEVNKAIHNQLVSQLTIEGQETETLEQAAQVYLNNSQTAYPEDSVMSETHQLQILVSTSFQSNEILSLRTEFFEFAGGAHGYDGVLYKNFMVASGQEVTSTDLFRDMPTFSAFAKAEFHKQQSETSITSPNWEALQFDNDVFRLPENIGFTEEGVQLYYHMYEIAAYQSEAFTLNISWDAVKEYLNF